MNIQHFLAIICERVGAKAYAIELRCICVLVELSSLSLSMTITLLTVYRTFISMNRKIAYASAWKWYRTCNLQANLHFSKRHFLSIEWNCCLNAFSVSKFSYNSTYVECAPLSTNNTSKLWAWAYWQCKCRENVMYILFTFTLALCTYVTLSHVTSTTHIQFPIIAISWIASNWKHNFLSAKDLVLKHHPFAMGWFLIR